MSVLDEANAQGLFSARQLGETTHDMRKLERNYGLQAYGRGSRWFYKKSDYEAAKQKQRQAQVKKTQAAFLPVSPNRGSRKGDSTNFVPINPVAANSRESREPLATTFTPPLGYIDFKVYADQINTARSTVRSWCDKGRVECVRDPVPGRSSYFVNPEAAKTKAWAAGREQRREIGLTLRTFQEGGN